MDPERKKHIGIGAAITFVLGLGPAIPALGLLLGPLFTFGGGLLGGGVAGGLNKQGWKEGLKIALIAVVVGGLASSVVASVGGTLLNVFLMDSEAGGSIVLAVIGFVSGLFFTVVGGAIGGAIGGVVTGSGDGAVTGDGA